MEEKNPLEPIPVMLPKKCLQSNASGRPTSEKATKFTPQPKSIISRLLRRVRKQNCDNIKRASLYDMHNIPISLTNKEHNIHCNNDPVLKQPQLTNTSHSVQENYAVELEDEQDNFKNGIDTEEQNNVQSNTATICYNNCEEPKLLEITCYVCSHRSTSQKAHRKHLSIHRNQPYICNFPDCKYTCKLSCNLIKHKRTHTSEKPYLCDQCTFRSNYVNSLKVHKRIHTSERPYGCTLCSYKCNSSSNLKKHCRHKHRNIS